MSTMFYAASVGGFYEAGRADLPADAVEVSGELYAALLAGQSAGRCIVADDAGQPVLANRPAPATDDLARNARSRRDALLTACDWVVMKATETGTAVPADWQRYRQALRDLPDQAGFPITIDWPLVPGEA